jgi:hypothetical protein
MFSEAAMDRGPSRSASSFGGDVRIFSEAKPSRSGDPLIEVSIKDYGGASTYRFILSLPQKMPLPPKVSLRFVGIDT